MTFAKAVAERRTHMVKAGHDDKGKQLYRPISARTVNRTVVYLLRRIMLRARDKWNTVIFKMPPGDVPLPPSRPSVRRKKRARRTRVPQNCHRSRDSKAKEMIFSAIAISTDDLLS